MQSEMRKLRTIKGVNAATVAARAGVSRQRYSYIESQSKIKTLEEETIRKISSSLECNVYELADVSQFLTVEPKTKEELALLIKKLKEKYGK